ncbi:metallophosphoesterase [Methanobacterium paludis]|uniref:Metallophosphoesterase n=2 Tax=Methanobacterium paludis (strain DSM 25820 / JCM 18151 / SWAN1) TaxID=868131 RepID=F6D5I0_METPW|nr:metallophosphoesterase [Methanobacterium paludis]
MQLAMSGFRDKMGFHDFNPGDFEVVPVKVTIPDLDPVFNNYRIVHISDIHLGQWISEKRIKGVVNLVNQQKPDLVAITGDSVSYLADEPVMEMLRSLKNLQPHDATVSVLGNHDHVMGAEKILKIMDENNIIDLNNDVYTLKRGEAMLHIAGVDSITLNHQDLDLVLEKLPSAGPAILLVHEPDFADTSAATGRFSLQLSGHSHGGQMVIPGFGTPFKGSNFKKYPIGKYQVGDMVQYTNRGLGTNVFWLRINCPPEITVFKLQSKNFN